MTKNSQRPVAKIEQPIGPALVDRISWNDLKLFMTAGLTLSFRKAATSTGNSPSTVMRWIERLEAELGLRLFDRLPDGVALTAEGQSIFSVVRDMERASHSLRAFLDQDLNNRASSDVRSPKGWARSGSCRTSPNTTAPILSPSSIWSARCNGATCCG